jgi:hypothetical protein
MAAANIAAARSANLAAAQGNYPTAAGMGTGVLADARHAAAVTAALQAQWGAYYRVADGAVTAADAVSALKAAQDGIIASGDVYNQQLSEYNTQLGNLEAAYQVVQKRQSEGKTLTQAETDILNGYAAAHERLAGGVDDATVALGEQALQYATNMTIGDQLNAGLADTTGMIGGLTLAIYDLILSMEGIPDEVRTKIEADREQAAYAVAATYDSMSQLDGTTATVSVDAYMGNYWAAINGATGWQGSAWIDVYANRIGFGPYGSPYAEASHGITMLAGGGSIFSGGYAIVGERGPEMIRLARGDQVTNTEATKTRLRGLGGGGDTIINLHGGLTILANNPTELATALVGHARR